MNCFVCGGEMHPFMEKSFGMKNLDVCEYVRCAKCGLVIAKTIYDMPRSQWEALNHECHAAYQNTNSLDVDPRWLSRLKAQAQVISELINIGVLDKNSNAVDYGAGDGKLSAFVAKNGWLKKFDAYMARPNENYLSAEDLKPASFDFVITCSVFEHLLGGGDVEKIFALLKPDGIAAIHTLICEEVPRDPNWFYLLPVHATFWTNSAMQKIFKQYEFNSCAYHVESRLWFMFRDKGKFLRTCAETSSSTWIFANDFVDYWKVKPYR